MRAAFALSRYELRWLLSSWRALGVLAAMAFFVYTSLDIPRPTRIILNEPNPYNHPLHPSLLDVVPIVLGRDVAAFGMHLLPAVLLGVALTAEDRERGGAWITLHRVGGWRRYWLSKAISLALICVLVVVVSVVLMLVLAPFAGFKPSFATSDYTTYPDMYREISRLDVAPGVEAVLLALVRIPVLLPVAASGALLGLLIRSRTVAYALASALLVADFAIIGLLDGWISEKWGVSALGWQFRIDPILQIYWKQHFCGANSFFSPDCISWWWKGLLLVWAGAALWALRAAMARRELVA